MRCPSCGKNIRPGSENQWRPFCSKRCQIIDLGDWLNEKHRIPSDDAQDELSDLPDIDDDDTTH